MPDESSSSPDWLSLASSGAQALAGFGQMLSGNAQKRAGIKMAQTTPDAIYSIPKEVNENARIAESEAGQGLSDGALQLYTQGLDRNTAAGLDAIIKGGGSINNIGDLYGGLMKGYANLAEVDENYRAQKVRQALAERQNEIDENEKKWLFNVYKPTQDRRQAAAALVGQGAKEASAGDNTMLQALSNFDISNLYKNKNVAPQTHPVVAANPGLQPGYIDPYSNFGVDTPINITNPDIA